MKVFVYSNHFQPAYEWGGPVASIWSLTKSLVKNGVDVKVLTTNATPSGKVDTKKISIEEGVVIERCGVIGKGKLKRANRLGWSMSTKRRINKLTEEADVVHVEGFWGGSAVAIRTAIKKKKPVVVCPRGNLETISLQNKRLLKYIELKMKIQIYLSKVNRIVFATEKEKIQTPKWIKIKNNDVIGNPIEVFSKKNKDIFRTKENLNNNNVVYGISGRINKQKGHSIVIEALKDIRIKKNLLLYIIGPDETNYKKKITRNIKKADLKNKIVFTGFLNKEKLNDVYAGLDYLLMPSYHESFGNAAIEAVQQGTNVIISDEVGVKDWIVKENVGVSLPLKKDSWTREIYESANVKMYKKKFRNNNTYNQLVKDNFSPDVIANRFIDLYGRILEGV